jgi:hypothetical protein
MNGVLEFAYTADYPRPTSVSALEQHTRQWHLNTAAYHRALADYHTQVAKHVEDAVGIVRDEWGFQVIEAEAQGGPVVATGATTDGVITTDTYRVDVKVKIGREDA